MFEEDAKRKAEVIIGQHSQASRHCKGTHDHGVVILTMKCLNAMSTWKLLKDEFRKKLGLLMPMKVVLVDVLDHLFMVHY